MLCNLGIMQNVMQGWNLHHMVLIFILLMWMIMAWILWQSITGYFMKFR